MSAQQGAGDEGANKLLHDAAFQQTEILTSLKKQREELDKEIDQKMRELNAAQELSNNLKDAIQTRSIRIEKKKETLENEKAAVAKAQKEAQEIQTQIEYEKKMQLSNIKVYEIKMKELAEQLRGGPKFYDQKNIRVEIDNLRKETNEVSKELAIVEEELNVVRMKYNLIFNTSGKRDNLSALQSVIFEMNQEKDIHDIENQKLHDELKNLTKISNVLKADVAKLKLDRSKE